MSGAITKLQEFIFAFKGYRKEFFDESVRDFFIILTDEIEDIRDAASMFDPSVFDFLYPLILEEFFTQIYETPNGKDWNVVEEFLSKNFKLINAFDREYLSKLANSYMSIYEVVEVDPGQSMLLKDLVEGGELILITEKMGTKEMLKWTRLATRVINMSDGKNLISGRCIILDDYLCGEMIPVLRDPELDKADWAEVILTCYLHSMIEKSEATMSNTEGQQMQLMTIYFPIKTDEASLKTALTAIAELDHDKHDDVWIWGKDTGNIGKTICAHISIQGKKLLVNVNSQERMTDIKKILESSLGEMIGAGLASVEDLSMLAKQSPKENSLSFANDDETTDMIKGLKDEYFRKWFDIPVPMLGDISPREAIRTDDGRLKLVDLLKYYERSEEGFCRSTGAKPYDFTWMWQELGLLAERR